MSYYQATLHEHVYCSGITESYNGERPSDPVTIYMFDSQTSNIALFNPSGDGEEFVALYDASGLTVPPKDALTIRKAVRRKNGSRRMWHWEVHAE